jgi:glycosyltransferase involved in cell wall biosynthesis
LPRLQLESPIDPDLIVQAKTKSNKIRIGCHSKGASSKWNSQYLPLIKSLNKRYLDRISWHFMGMNKELARSVASQPNVELRKEFDLSVKDFLAGIDIFIFFPSWDREEPWSRAVAEGLMSGCPVLATDKGGNKDQVIHGNNGFLCKKEQDYRKWLIYLIENPNVIKTLGQNAKLYSKNFATSAVIHKLMEFLDV